MNEDVLIQVKAGLASHLEKAGSSLEEFEAALAKGDESFAGEKLANVMGALGAMGGKALDGMGSLALAMPELAAIASIGSGALVGGGLYAADKHLGNQDKRIGEKQQEVDRLRQITERLKSDYNIK